MSDWAVGDLAVCVDGSPRTMEALRGTPFPISAGQIRRVIGLGKSERPGSVSLFLDGECAYFQKHGYGFAEGRFRKIDQHEPCEEEFQTLLKRSKRKVSA